MVDMGDMGMDARNWLQKSCLPGLVNCYITSNELERSTMLSMGIHPRTFNGHGFNN